MIRSTNIIYERNIQYLGTSISVRSLNVKRPKKGQTDKTKVKRVGNSKPFFSGNAQ